MSLFSWQSPRAVETFWRIWSKHIFQKLWMYKRWVCVCAEFFVCYCFHRFALWRKFYSIEKKEPSYALLQHDGYVGSYESYTWPHIREKNAHIFVVIIFASYECLSCACVCADWTYVRQAFFLRSSKELIYWLFVWFYSFGGLLLLYSVSFSLIFGSDWERCFWQSVGI